MSRTITAAEAINDRFSEVRIGGKWVAVAGVGQFDSQIVTRGGQQVALYSNIQLALVIGTEVGYDAYGEHEVTRTRLHSQKLAADQKLTVR